MKRLTVALIFCTVLIGLSASAQECNYCDETTGIGYWDAGRSPLFDYSIRCWSEFSQYTICGGYSSSLYGVARFTKTSVGTPHAIQNNGTTYLTYGHHNWDANLDRAYLGTSSNGKNFSHRLLLDNWQVCPFGACEGLWAPELAIRDDGTWLLFFTGRHSSTEMPGGSRPRVFMATSNDGGWSWTVNFGPWVTRPDGQGGWYRGILTDTTGGDYRFATVSAQPSGQFVLYATSNVDNYVYRFTSWDGINWTRQNSLGFWGLNPTDVKYDAVSGHFMMTLDPPLTISSDCTIPSWRYPAIVLSTDGSTGASFSYPSIEHYFNGSIVTSAEAAPLGDRKGIIQPGTPLLVYMNDQESATYNNGGTTNGLFVMDWRRGSGEYCAYP